MPLEKKLNLPNSSNRVEKENDLVLALRQKHKGMAFTRKGSDALALFTTLNRNNDGLKNDRSLSNSRHEGYT